MKRRILALLSPDLAAGIRRVKGAKRLGLRIGNWLTVEQSRTLLGEPPSQSPRGKRDRAILDEEIVINPALAVKLGEDFNVQLPAVPENWDSGSLEKFLADFEAEIEKYEWSVEQESWLGLFRQPNPGENESRRSIEEISSEEIALAMTSLVRDSLSIERDSLLLYVARIFGFERTGNHIQNALEKTIDKLVETHQLVVLDGRVSLPK